MFEFIRTHQRLMQLLLLILVFPAFALFGIEGYTRFFGPDQALAEVEGRAITQQEFDGVMRQQEDQLRRSFGANFDPKMLDTPERRKQLLDGIIDDRLISAEAQHLRLTVSDAALRNAIMSQGFMQQLRKPDGSIDIDAYKALLAAQGMTPEQYDARMRFAMASGKPGETIGTSGLASTVVAEKLGKALEQEREAQELLVSPKDYAAKVVVDDAALKAFYDANKARFTLPEQAKVEYLVLSAEAIAADTHPSDAYLKAAYEARKAQYAGQEQRRASHILISAGKDAKAADKTAAKAKAQALLEALRKKPESFADVAKKESQDPGSAAQGGDLGFFGRGAMVKAFEDTAFKLKEGEISDIVESDFGYHIIKLTGIKEAKTQPFEAVKAELEAQLKKDQAAKRYAEIADGFSNMVYDQYDSLKPAADKYKLKIQSADGVTRQPSQTLANTPLTNDKLLRVLFADDAVKNKRNTEAVQVALSTLVSARIVDYKPAQLKPLEQVKDEVKAALIAKRSVELAKEAGEAMLKKAQAGEAPQGFGKTQWISRRSKDVAAPSLAAVMRADAVKLPAYAGADLGEKGYAIYKVTQVKQPEKIDEAKAQSTWTGISGILSEREYRAYLDGLRQRSKVKMGKQAPAAAQS
ncbi:MAG: SurA N-terminal domain-containing protein [Candidatus Protistobacter heckmanni]|nr:SurA N-terminal domain-containing protein [Candidatus Protistobacter heckmanni]